MATSDDSCPSFIDKTVDFPDGISYELLEPLTNFRKNQDGTPAEGRIVFTCRQVTGHQSGTEYVVKVKVQVPYPGELPEEGPSTATASELEAFETFTKAKNSYVPHLVAFKKDVQGVEGMVPGGFITYQIMTKMAGQNLHELRHWYWGASVEEREEIVHGFLVALRSIFALGIEPMDRALRNVIWEREAKKCTIVDFELWRATKEGIADETKELQRWGLVKRAPPKTWWGEWAFHDT